jgi:hypothetical protein
MQPDKSYETEEERRARERARRLRAEQVQRRRLALGVVVLGLIVLIVILVIALSGGNDQATTTTTSSDGSDIGLTSANYSAKLNGAESVPPVTTSASADLILEYDATTKQLTFVLEITHQLKNPSTAAIYQGYEGTSGAVVYTLFAGPTIEGNFTGILADGTILDADLTGPLQGQTIADLIALIKDGQAYVSIGNTSHPLDAIRGQID